MPGALLGAIGAAAISGGIAAYIAGSSILIGALIAGAFAAVNYLLVDRPDGGALGSPDEVKLTIREPAPYRHYILGARRVGCVELMKDTRRAPDADADNDGYLDWIQIIADHPCEAVERIYINGSEVLFDANGDVLSSSRLASLASRLPALLAGTIPPRDYDLKAQREVQSRYFGHAHIEFRLDGASPAFPSLDRHGAWDSSTDKATGCALMYFRALWNREVYPNGEPDVELQVKGANDVADPRTGAEGWTDNAALLIAWLLGKFPNLNVRKINMQSLIDAANICDQQVSVPLEDGTATTSKRYRLNAHIKLNEDIQRILPECAKTIGGDIHYSHVGGWRIEPGRARTPVATLTEDDIAGTVSVMPKIPIDYRANTILPHFISEDNESELTSLPGVTNPRWVSDDGQELIEQLDYLYITDKHQAVALARQYLAVKRSEMEITISLRDFETGMGLHAGAAVRFSYSPLGLSGAIFVVIKWRPVLDGDNLTFELTLKQHDAAAYNVSSDFRDYRISPPNRSSLLSARYVPLLRGLAAMSGADQLQVLQDGTVNSRIELSWRASSSPYADHVEITYRKETDADDEAKTITGSGGRAYISQVEDGVAYRIEARYVNSLGVRGKAATISHGVIGKSERPAAPTSLALEQDDNEIVGLVSAPTDRDVYGIHVKYIRGSFYTPPDELPAIETDAQWDAAIDVGVIPLPPLARNQVQERFRFLAGVSGRYRVAVRFVDTSGNESEIFSTTGLFSRKDSNIYTQAYAPEWPGTLDGYIRHKGALLPKGVKAGDAVSVREWMTTFAGPQKPDDIPAATTEETFDWTAAQADVEGLVGRQTGIPMAQRAGRPLGYLITTPTLTALDSAIGQITRLRVDFEITRIGFASFSGPTSVADFPDDVNRSLVLRLTLSDGSQFTGILALIDDESAGPNDDPNDPPTDVDPPDSSYRFTVANNAVSAALNAFIPNSAAASPATLDFALVENSAGWRQDGANVVRDGDPTPAIPRAAEISFTAPTLVLQQPIHADILRHHVIERLPYADPASYDPALGAPTLNLGNFERVGINDANISHDYFKIGDGIEFTEEFDFADDAEGLVGKITDVALREYIGDDPSISETSRPGFVNDEAFPVPPLDDSTIRWGYVGYRLMTFSARRLMGISAIRYVGGDDKSFVLRLKDNDARATFIFRLADDENNDSLAYGYSTFRNQSAELLDIFLESQQPLDYSQLTADIALVENSAGWQQIGHRIIRQIDMPDDIATGQTPAIEDAQEIQPDLDVEIIQPRHRQRINQGNPGGMIIKATSYTIKGRD